MDSSVMYELGNLVDIGLKLLFYITLFSFTLYTVFLGYHWFSYGTDRHTSTLSLAVYLIGAAPLLISMALLQ